MQKYSLQERQRHLDDFLGQLLSSAKEETPLSNLLHFRYPFLSFFLLLFLSNIVYWKEFCILEMFQSVCY